MSKTRRETNWEAELQSTEIVERKEGNRTLKVVLLKGLQRLANEAGLLRSDCYFKFITVHETGTVGIMQAVYSTEFADGSKWVGTADCNSKNTSEKFMAYPTAVAESRAEARCLRKALNISILSSEELGSVEGIEQIEASPGKKIDSQVVKAIEKLCEGRGVAPATVLEEVLSKERNGSVFELTELTVEEGQKAMAWLNDQKPQKKKASAAEERDARKKELQAKAGE